MVIVLDTNIWIKGLRLQNLACQTIIDNVINFNSLFPAQVRQELDNNFDTYELNLLYDILNDAAISIDYSSPPTNLREAYYNKGLRKGDMLIAAYCDWHHVDVIISTNRDFLRGISGETSFQVMSPEQFCTNSGLL